MRNPPAAAMGLCRMVALLCLSVCVAAGYAHSSAVMGFEEGISSNDSCLLNNIVSPHHCSREPASCQFTLSWWDNFDVIEFNLTAKTLAKTTVIGKPKDSPVWAAVGFSDNRLMANTDVVRCILHSNGTQSIENGWTVRHTYTRDNQQSQKLVQLREINYTNNIFLCRFSRQKFCTNASADRNLTTPWYILMVWGMDPTKPHNVDETFASMCRCNVTDCSEHYSCIDEFKLLLLKLHGTVMTLALVLFMPTAAILARYYRNIFTDMWFKSHTTLMMIGVVCMLAGLIFILGHTGGQFSVGPHQIIGVVTIGLAVFQAVGGVLRPRVGRTLRRRLFEIGHKLNAIAVLLLGSIVLFLGAWLLSNQLWQWMEGVIGLSVATSLILVVVLEVNSALCSAKDPPVGYRKVSKPADPLTESEDEVFVREEHQNSTPKYSKERAIFLLFLLQSFSFAGIVSAFVCYGHSDG